MQVENILLCSKCHQNYNINELIPLQLQCKHSQCKVCCEKEIQKEGLIVCNICQKVDNRKLDQLSRNQTTIIILLTPVNVQKILLNSAIPQAEKKEEEQAKKMNEQQEIPLNMTSQEFGQNELKNYQSLGQNFIPKSQTFQPNQFISMKTPQALIQSQNTLIQDQNQQFHQPLPPQIQQQHQIPQYNMNQIGLNQIQYNQQQQPTIQPQFQSHFQQNMANQGFPSQLHNEQNFGYSQINYQNNLNTSQTPMQGPGIFPPQQGLVNNNQIQPQQEKDKGNSKTLSKQVSLFIGNLSNDTTEQQIKESFEKITPVSKIKLLKVEVTTNNRAAFVSVANDKAEEVIAKMNGFLINVQKQKRIAKLKSVREKLTQGLYRNVTGKISSVKLQKNVDGSSRLMGYIVYDSVEAAKAAITKFNNYQLTFQNETTVLQVFDANELKNHRNQVEVSQYDPSNPVSSAQVVQQNQQQTIEQILLGSKRPADEQIAQTFNKQQKLEDPSQYKSIRINFLPEQINKKTLETLFELIANQEQVVIQQGPKGRYAYINFINTERAQAALKKFNGMTLHNGVKLQIKPSYPKMIPSDFSVQEQGPSSTLFIKYFPVEYTENDIKSLFKQFGEIADIKINKERVVPMGLVQFKLREDAEKALNSMKGVELKPGLKLFINWKKDYQATQGLSFEQSSGGVFQPPPTSPDQQSQQQQTLGQNNILTNLQQPGSQLNQFLPLQNPFPNPYITPSQQNHYNYQ